MLCFSIGKSPVTVQANIHKFYSDFKIGFFSGDSIGEVTFFVQVKGANSQMFHANTYTADGKVEGILLASGDNAKQSIELAFANAIRKVMRDDLFIQAILKAHAAVPSGGTREKQKMPTLVPTS